MSVKPWFPNLEKKNKKRFGDLKNFTYLCKTNRKSPKRSLKILFIRQIVDDETFGLILRFTSEKDNRPYMVVK